MSVPVEILEIGEKGRGVVAKRSIPEGACLLLERPLEMDLTSLQREVANVGELYETLRAKVEHAKVSQQVELQSQENRFQILDQARVPLRHASPNAPMITVAGFVGGVFLGIGLIFLFEFLDQAVVREEEMVFVFDETILATIPKLHT